MKTRLIAISAPLIDGVESAEDLIVYAARVSNPNNQLNMGSASKLLAYCIREGHWSIFEQASMTVEIETSRAISTQILRHRSFSFQEFSQRYKEITAFDDSFEIYQARRQDTKNRQNSIDNMAEEDRLWFEAAQLDIQQLALEKYEESLDRGIAKEQARFLLPLNVKTRLYMTGNIRSWIHYLSLRSENGTQKEHMEIAHDIRDNIFNVHFPNTAAALGWNGVDKEAKV